MIIIIIEHEIETAVLLYFSMIFIVVYRIT